MTTAELLWSVLVLAVVFVAVWLLASLTAALAMIVAVVIVRAATAMIGKWQGDRREP